MLRACTTGLPASLAVCLTAAAACSSARSQDRDGAADEPQASCGAEDPNAVVDVTGRYYYSSDRYALRGTITFVQVDRMIRVTETTYDNADDRPLMGQGMLVGNRANMTLVPTNGDTDYSAAVGFRFDHPVTASFCVTGFVDTNGDSGGAGSYRGERL